MPSLLIKPTTKQWGKADRALLHQLVAEGRVDIKDLSTENINSVQKKHFAHCTQQNFRRNFKDFATTNNLNLGLAGVR
jgi:hypothetical protein